MSITRLTKQLDGYFKVDYFKGCFTKNHWNGYASTRPELHPSKFDLLGNARSLSQTYRNFTHCFFEEDKLYDFLKNPTLIQLGAQQGDFLKQCADDKHYKDKKLVGVEYCDFGVLRMKWQNLNVEQIDLNTLSDNNAQLQLKQHLNDPIDLVAVRVIEYLQPDALSYLLNFIMNEAKTGSRFIFVHSVTDPQKDSIDRATFPVGFISSFFAPRADMVILSNELSSITCDRVKKDRDEVVVIEKIKI